MNIGYLVVKHPLLGGGIEKYTREVAGRLTKRGHHVTVFSMPHYGPLCRHFDGVSVRRVPCIKRSFAEKLSASATGAALATFAKERFDIIHLHSVAAGAFAWLPHCRQIPCVLQMHGIEWQRSRWSPFGLRILKWLEHTSVRQADALTAVSQLQCDFYRDTYGVTMQFIPTGADVKPLVEPEMMLALGLQPQGYILFASRLVREKGAHYLIAAFREANPTCQLVIAGDASGEKDYKKELSALAADDPRIRFVGFIQGRLLDELFSHALAYVQPSEMEGLSIALLEAMSYGNVCLVSDIPENREAIGPTGFCFRTRDVADLARKLRTITVPGGDFTALRQSARQRVLDRFSWDTITDKLERLYDQVLHKPAR